MRLKIKLGARSAVAAVAAALAMAAAGPAGPAAAQNLPGGTWGTAIPVSLAQLAPAGAQFAGGSIQDVSCDSPGNCAAIGTYYVVSTTGGELPYPFALTETGGAWSAVSAISGTASSLPVQGAATAIVSCGGPGACVASWSYSDTSGGGHAYLIGESQGAWGQAQAVTMGSVGTWLSSVSCPAVGDCTAVGSYLDGAAGSGLPFVMDSAAGVWDAPQEVGGVAGLSSPSPLNAGLGSVACSSAGNCIAGGSYHVASTDNQNHGQPFLAVETAGSWGPAHAVAGMTTLNPNDAANFYAISCGGPGACAATGVYSNTTGSYYTWVADESAGTWRPAQQLGAPAPASRMSPSSVSCTAQGYCAIDGTYVPAATRRAFVATYTGGAWTAQDVPGLAAATQSAASGLSCGAPGSCTAVGNYYPAGSGQPTEFIANEVSGAWATAGNVPGMPGGLPELNGLSCASAGYCTAVGAGGNTAVTVSEATAATVTLQPTAPTLTYGNEQAETFTATVASPAGGTPTGTVTVNDGTLTGCRITLINGTGSCALPSTAVPAGIDQLTATYSGDASYAAASSAATVTVAAATTTATLAISPATVTFGTSYHAVVSVTVKPQFGGTPTGGVTVDLNGTDMCGPSLTDGAASCIVPAGLSGGRYQLTASYGGDGNFEPSNSAPQYLTVAREKSSTTLALSKTTITYGHENAETLTVNVASAVPGSATGKVTVKAGGTAICVITLQTVTGKSTGSCILKATQLKAGSYQLSASYAGDGNNAPSTSASKTLKVVA